MQGVKIATDGFAELVVSKPCKDLMRKIMDEWNVENGVEGEAKNAEVDRKEKLKRSNTLPDIL